MSKKYVNDFDYFDWNLLRDKPVTLYVRETEEESFFYCENKKYVLGTEFNLSKAYLKEGFGDIEKFMAGPDSNIPLGKYEGFVSILNEDSYYFISIVTDDYIIPMSIDNLVKAL